MTPLGTTKAVAAYLYNTSAKQIADDVYGEDAHEHYKKEKAHALTEKHGFTIFFGRLDSKHQQKFVDAAMKGWEG